MRWQAYAKRKPKTRPKPTDKTMSTRGKRMEKPMLTVVPPNINPLTTIMVLNKMMPTTSSIETAASKKFVKGPFALYSRMTIKVLAGPVAAAIVPSIRMAGIGKRNQELRRSSPIATITAVNTDCRIERTAPGLPTSFRFFTENVSPIEKAMKERPICAIRKS